MITQNLTLFLVGPPYSFKVDIFDEVVDKEEGCYLARLWAFKEDRLLVLCYISFTFEGEALGHQETLEKPHFLNLSFMKEI